MNFLAHAHVARLGPGGDDPAFVLGAVLPDLLHMAGLRLERDAVPPVVAEGWRAHHRVDALFHAHTTFTTGVGDLRTELRRTGLATGPRRATAHVGWELLLDDAVVADARTTRVFRQAIRLADRLVDDDRWRTLLGRLDATGPETTDAGSWSLARRVQRAVARRPRLAFPDEFLAPVDAVLDGHRIEVLAAAPALLSDLVGAQWGDGGIDES